MPGGDKLPGVTYFNKLQVRQMSKRIYVYSTMTGANTYGQYVKGGGDIPERRNVVVINGGANAVNKLNRLHTPLGAVTEITEAELAICEADPVFKAHKANGFITVDDKAHNVNDVASGMKSRDESSPLTADDLRKNKDSDPEVSVAGQKEKETAQPAKRTRRT